MPLIRSPTVLLLCVLLLALSVYGMRTEKNVKICFEGHEVNDSDSLFEKKTNFIKKRMGNESNFGNFTKNLRLSV